MRGAFKGSVRWILLVFWGTAVLGAGAWGGGSSVKTVSKETREIDKSCKAIDAAVKGGQGSQSPAPELFAVSAPGAAEEWKAFPAEADLQTACPKGCYRIARFYRLSTNTAFVSGEFKGPSREWVQYLKYYFREDGSLEKIHSDYRRFGAYQKSKGMDQQFLVKVLRDRYYDTQGKCIKKTSPRCFNVSTGRELRDVVFTDAPWLVYPRVENLPFYTLASSGSDPSPVPTPTP